jgi:hypothetical protein
MDVSANLRLENLSGHSSEIWPSVFQALGHSDEANVPKVVIKLVFYSSSFTNQHW